jgi:hypothetical protein
MYGICDPGVRVVGQFEIFPVRFLYEPRRTGVALGPRYIQALSGAGTRVGTNLA